MYGDHFQPQRKNYRGYHCAPSQHSHVRILWPEKCPSQRQSTSFQELALCHFAFCLQRIPLVFPLKRKFNLVLMVITTMTIPTERDSSVPSEVEPFVVLVL